MFFFCKVVGCVLSFATRACDCRDGLLSKRINSGGSIKIIFNGKFLSLLVNSAVSWLFVFYFLQLGVLLYLDRCG